TAAEPKWRPAEILRDTEPDHNTETCGSPDTGISAMASAHGRLGQHFLAVLDVVLRVPSIFIIDTIFNS
ncbi:hypothetical protein M9458_039095, partial [Cirrhinus mrigala]